MDKFASLEAFHAVARAGSFAGAARLLGTSRSQINRQVIQLEDHLGVTLFQRTTRRVSLTPTGEAFLLRIEPLLADLRDAEKSLVEQSHSPQGELRINAPMSFGTLHLGPAIAEFMRLYPGIRIQLQLDDRFVDPVSEGFDVTVRVAEPRDNPSLIEHVICPAPRILCASPRYLAGRPGLKHPRDLARENCLHYGNLPGGNLWALQHSGGERLSLRVQGVLCCNNAEVLRDACEQGLGVASLPVFLAERSLETGALVRVLDAWEPPPISLTLVYPPNRHLATRVRVFVRFMQKRFGHETNKDPER